MSCTQESSTVADMRGQMFRAKRHMPDAGAREFLRQQMTAHVGTVDANGWPIDFFEQVAGSMPDLQRASQGEFENRLAFE